MANSWTDDRVERLKTLWSEGFSCSQISRSLGGGMSRNAVIGKVTRLGLSGAQARAERPRVAPVLRNTPMAPALAPVTEPEPPMVFEGGICATVETVSDRMCRWPIGDPLAEDFHFCGHAPRAGSPYCEPHALKAYQPQQARRTAEEGDRHRHKLRPGQMSLWA